MTIAREKLLDIENDGLNMAVDGQYLYLRANRDVVKYDLVNKCELARSELFRKDGKARGIFACGALVLLTDFCDLHILDARNLRMLEVYRLGADQSSDIWGARLYQNRVFAAVRSGKMAVLDMHAKAVEKHDITGSSFWDYTIASDKIYAGTVRGELLEIDAASMRVVRKMALTRNKNICSVIAHGGTLYMAAQDFSIHAVDIACFERVSIAKKAVGGMARVLGVAGDHLIAADSNKISLWDRHTLEKRDVFPFPTGSFNKGAALAGGVLIGSDLSSVYRAEMKP